MVHLVDNVVVRMSPQEVVVLEGEFRDERRPVTFSRGYLDSGSFSDFAYGRGVDAEDVNAQLLAVLHDKISRIDVPCHLTEMQSTKLKLAGRGDIKRFFDCAHQAESRFAQYRELDDKPALAIWLKEMKSMHDNLRYNSFTQIFGSRSLFSHTFQNVLTVEQKLKFSAQ